MSYCIIQLFKVGHTLPVTVNKTPLSSCNFTYNIKCGHTITSKDLKLLQHTVKIPC